MLFLCSTSDGNFPIRVATSAGRYCNGEPRRDRLGLESKSGESVNWKSLTEGKSKFAGDFKI